MALTAYCSLSFSQVTQVSPPRFTSQVEYAIYDSVQSALVATQQNGTMQGVVQVTMTPPITNQSAVLSALQSAVQAAEPGSPGLSFIWLKI